MAATKPNVLRKIAESSLDRYLTGLDPEVKQELATTLARQWITGDGHAGLATPSHHFWFDLVRKVNGFDVGFDRQPPQLAGKLREAGVPEEAIPGLLHKLNLCQTVLCETRDGRRYRVRMIARERKFLPEPVDAEEE
jgi:hypothetical protein